MADEDRSEPGLALDRRAFLASGAALAAASLPAAAAPPAIPGAGPYEVTSIETVWIPMRDGVRLAARLWLPKGHVGKIPAIMMYWPYRRRDIARIDDEQLFNYFASHGYACLAPDIRGSGDSEGVLKDEYLEAEQTDGVDLIAWIERQPWSSGKVGMIGLSWSGFSALQVAAKRPPALKALIVHGASDDRYTDDAHYLGGAVSQDMFIWGSVFYSLQAFPPDPAVVGPRWRDMWRQRCESIDFSVGEWVAHQRRDEFWKHGSINEDYRAVDCPVYAIGGWADGYPNAIPRLMEHLTVPRKALIGPWGHSFPHVGGIGPKFDYLDEARRWWDHWLKGVDTGIMAEPAFRAYIGDDAARHGVTWIPGRWVADREWPAKSITPQTFYLRADGLSRTPGAGGTAALHPDQTVGVTAGTWCPAGSGDQHLLAVELPTEQGLDDGRSLTFDTQPLAGRIEVLGFPEVELLVTVDQPVAMLSVRLNEVMPDESVRRVSYGILNLTHRDGDETPTALVPGKPYRVRFKLRVAGYAFKAGSRIRVAISTSFWPLVVPPPRPVRLVVTLGESSLSLPVREPQDGDRAIRTFAPPLVPPTTPVSELKPDTAATKLVSGEIATGTQTISTQAGGGIYRYEPIGTEVSQSATSKLVINKDDPSTARGSFSNIQSFRRAGTDWDVKIATSLSYEAGPDHYLIAGSVKAYDAGREFFSKAWTRQVPRDLS